MSEVAKLDQRPEQPLLHTVAEAAAVLRVGRSLAYTLARSYRDSGGREGLPVMRVGNCLRVPRWALLELANTGRVVALSELASNESVPRMLPPGDEVTSGSADGSTSDVADPPSASPIRSVSRVSRARRPRRGGSFEQLVLRPSPD